MGVHPEPLAEVGCVRTLTGQVTLFKIHLHFLRKLKLLLPGTLWRLWVTWFASSLHEQLVRFIFCATWQPISYHVATPQVAWNLLVLQTRGPWVGRRENLRPVGDEDGRGASNGHSSPCPLDHTGPLVFSARQDSELPSVPRLSRPLGYLPFSRFLQGAQRGRAAGSGRAALCWPASPFSSLSWLLQFSSRRLITVMEACPLRPLHSTVLWLEGHSHLLFFHSLCGFCCLPVRPPRTLLHQSVHQWIPEEGW